MQLGRVFVSSVFGGMLDLRQVAAEAADLVGLEPVLTEEHIAQPASVRSALEREIAACDTYVGLFDRRRGTVPPTGTEDHRAITEQEFHLARALGLRCLAFLSRAAADRDPKLNDFLDQEVSDYETGVWARPYGSEEELRREIAAGLAALRPRVVLALEESREARLFLSGVKPAWTGEAVLGPVPVDLKLGPVAAGVASAFRSGPAMRSRIKKRDIQLAGLELAAWVLPDELGKALDAVLDLAAGRLVTLEIRTSIPEALAIPWELLSLPGHPLPVREGLFEIVRRIPAPGEPLDPARDPAPSIPEDHLSVLGFTAAPVEDLDIVALPGAGGLRDADLFWEREQERLLVALDGLLRERRGRLILPDTGDKEVLRARLARPDRPQVVHISCHGGSIQEKDGAAEPVLFLEDREGRREPLRAGELLSWVRTGRGEDDLRLLVLSACSTAGVADRPGPAPGHRAVLEEAEAVDRAAGLAETLVHGGLSRVLGMQSTVSDAGATAFAEKLYERLAEGADLPAALRAGRAELAFRGEPHEWAVPTLTTRRDAGPLVAPRGSAPPVETPFEAAREDFEIAGVAYLEQGYVGRRDAERRLRHAFDRGERVIVIHGLGGIGKSTLAARFLERRQSEGARLLVLYAGRELAPVILLEEVAAKVEVTRPAGLSPEEADRQFRKDLGRALREVAPTVLDLDNFEDNQDGDGNLKNPDLGEAILDLVDLGGAGFQVVITSRLPVTLPPGPVEACNLDLGELSSSGCRKLRLLDPAGLGSLSEDAWTRVLFHFGGHPKALELLGGYLRGRPDRARTLLANLGRAVGEVDRRLAAERQRRGRSLLVDAVLESVPDERRPALDRLCLLDLPLPAEELEMLLGADGVADPAGDLAWLRDHGVLAQTLAPSALAGGDLIHRLLASRRQTALAEREGEEVVRGWHFRVAEHLIQPGKPLSNFGPAARHRDAAGDRAGALELYSQWSLTLRDQNAYLGCLQIAREGLERFPAGKVEMERVGAAKLWGVIHDGSIVLGKSGDADSSLEQAMNLMIDVENTDARFYRASFRLRKSKRLMTQGKRHEAEEELRKALEDFEAGDHARDRAITLGEIAHLRAQSGDVSGALKLYGERLEIFEQLGDVRSRAVTLGEIARLRAQSGDVSGALKLHGERLEIFEQLGDVWERAVALGDIGRLRAQSGDVSGALKLHGEILEIFEQLGDVRSRAVTLGDIARLRAQSGDVSGALKLHEEMLEIFGQLGDVRECAVTLGDIARLRAQSGDVSGALKLHEEELRTYEQLGDVRLRAVTLGNIARLHAQSGDVSGALRLQTERLDIHRSLGDVDEIAAAQFDLAKLDLSEERFSEALDRLAESWEINLKTGRANGIAFVGLLYGRLLATASQSQALEVLRTSRDAFQRLGMTAEVSRIDGLIQELEAGAGPAP